MDRVTRSSAATPKFFQESCKEYPYSPCQDIFCQGSQGQGQVKPSPRTSQAFAKDKVARRLRARVKGVALVMGFSVCTEATIQSSEGPLSSTRQGCYVSWEGDAQEERDLSACAGHRAVRGACFALAPQYGPPQRGVPTSLGCPTTRKGQGIHRLIRSVEENTSGPTA